MRTALIILMVSMTGCVAQPVWKNPWSTNQPPAAVHGSYEARLDFLSFLFNTNLVSFTNGNVGFGTNTPDAKLVLQGGKASDNGAGNGSDAVQGFNLVGQNGGNGSVNGGSADVTDNLIIGGVGGTGTNGSGGAGGSISIKGGAGSTGSVTGGSGGSLLLVSGAGAFGTNVGGAGGALSMAAGAGGTSVTNAAGDGGTVIFAGGMGGRSIRANGGAGGQIALTSGFGNIGNLTGGAGGDASFVSGVGGRGTNSGGAGGALTLNTGNGGNATTNTAGAAGNATLSAGSGGNSSLGVGGAGGRILINSGTGGTGVTNGNGGSIYVQPGTGTSNGVVALGSTVSGTPVGWVGFATPQGFNPINAFASFNMLPTANTPITLTGGGGFVTVTNWSSQVTNYFVGRTNQGNLTNLITGWYRVHLNASVDNVSATSHIHGHLFTNGVECPLLGWETDSIGGLLTVSGAANGILFLPAGTQISERLQDTGGGGTFVVVHAGLTVGSP